MRYLGQHKSHVGVYQNSGREAYSREDWKVSCGLSGREVLIHCDGSLFVFIYDLFLLVRCSLKKSKSRPHEVRRVPESFYDCVRTVVAYTIKTSLHVCSVVQAM